VNLDPWNRGPELPRVSIRECDALPFTQSRLDACKDFFRQKKERKNPLYSLFLSLHLLADQVEADDQE